MTAKKQKTKILFLLDSLAFGGAEKQTVSLINRIDTETYDIHLIYFNKREHLLSQIKRKRLTLLKCMNRSGKFDIQTLKNLNSVIDTCGFDIVICVDTYTLLYAYICKYINKIRFRLICVMHSTIPRPGLWVKTKNFLYQKMLNRCDNVIFVCQNQMDYWKKNYKIKSPLAEYIYNGIDTSYFADMYSKKEKTALRESLGFGKDDFIAGICAVLRPEKKHTDLIKAVSIVRDNGLSVKCLIIGDGEQRKVIEKYIDDKNLSTDIRITGFQKDVRPFISICDCMVLASHQVETFSIATLESMAMGKPVIMTDIGGANEQVNNGVNGFIYDKGDIGTLADKLKFMASNPEKAQNMGKMSKEIVTRRFSNEKMTNAYEEMFNRRHSQ